MNVNSHNTKEEQLLLFKLEHELNTSGLISRAFEQDEYPWFLASPKEIDDKDKGNHSLTEEFKIDDKHFVTIHAGLVVSVNTDAKTNVTTTRKFYRFPSMKENRVLKALRILMAQRIQSDNYGNYSLTFSLYEIEKILKLFTGKKTNTKEIDEALQCLQTTQYFYANPEENIKFSLGSRFTYAKKDDKYVIVLGTTEKQFIDQGLYLAFYPELALCYPDDIANRIAEIIQLAFRGAGKERDYREGMQPYYTISVQELGVKCGLRNAKLRDRRLRLCKSLDKLKEEKEILLHENEVKIRFIKSYEVDRRNIFKILVTDDLVELIIRANQERYKRLKKSSYHDTPLFLPFVAENS